MLKANGLPPVLVGYLFGVKVMIGVGAASSQESVAIGASGFQEEGYEEMMSLGEGVDGEMRGGAVGGEKRPKVQREARPRDPRKEKLMPQRRAFRSMEELPTAPTERVGTLAAKGEERLPPKERESQAKKVTEIDSKDLGLQIYAPETKPFPKQPTYENITEEIRAGNIKFIFRVK